MTCLFGVRIGRSLAKVSRFLAFTLAVLAAGVLDAPAAQLKAMTWNIAGAISATSWNTANSQSIGRIANYYQPDMIGFCEVDYNGSDAQRNALTANLQNWANAYLTSWPSKYVYVSTTSDGYESDAFVSKYPMYNMSQESCDPRGLVGVMVSLPGGAPVKLYLCHLKAYSDSSSAQRRQNGATSVCSHVSDWSLQLSNADIPYVIMGDMNEDEENPQTPITGSYHPITTLLQAYVQNYRPDDGYGNTKTISSGSPTRRFDYVLPSWGLKPDWTNTNPLWSRVINSSALFSHGQLPPGVQRLDSQSSDHLPVIGTFDLLSNSLSSVRATPNGQYAALMKKNVTASFADHFYIEDPVTRQAIRVNCSAGCPPVDALVSVRGTMNASATAEDVIVADGVRVLNTILGATVPVAMSNRDTNGEPYNGTWVTDRRGPLNAALLIKTWGSVTSTESGAFDIDDGGGCPVRVSSNKTVNTGDFVTVVGVVGFYVPSGSTAPQRLVKTRFESDVVVFPR